MDRMLRAEIIATVRQTVAEVMEGADDYEDGVNVGGIGSI